MKRFALSAEGREILEHVEYMRQTDCVVVVCMTLFYAGQRKAPALEAYLMEATRGKFKRAIKSLRELQASGYSRHPERMDAVIAYIRREWLHREAVAV